MAVSLTNPFRRIVGVGWNTARYVAFSIAVTVSESDNTVNTPPEDPGPSGRRHLTLDQFYNIWKTSFTGGSFNLAYAYSVGSQPTAMRVLRGETWGAAETSDFVIDGGLPTFTGGGSIGPFQSGDPESRLWHLTAGGSGGAVAVPGNPSIMFDKSTSPVFRWRHTTIFTGGPEWVDAPDFGVKYAAETAPGTDDIFSDNYPAPALVLFKNKAYRLCATAGIPSSAATLWLLYERSQADDPTA